MPEPTPLDVAEALAALMVTRGFTPTPTIAAALLPVLEVSAGMGLQISIIPLMISSEAKDGSRALDKDVMTINIGIQKRLAGLVGVEKTEVNTLFRLVLDIKKFVSRLSPMADVQWRKTTVELWDPVHLQGRVFTSVLHVEYITYAPAGG